MNATRFLTNRNIAITDKNMTLMVDRTRICAPLDRVVIDSNIKKHWTMNCRSSGNKYCLLAIA